MILGTSTSELLIKLSNYSNKKAKFIGLDIEKKMTDYSKKLIRSKKIKNIKIELKDITKYLLKSDMIISYYTIQFINPKYRQLSLNKI